MVRLRLASTCLVLLLAACAGSERMAAGTSQASEAVTSAPANLSRRGPPVPPDAQGPCGWGQQTTLDGARANADFTVVLPTHYLANESSIRRVCQLEISVNRRREVHADGSTETPRSFRSVAVTLHFDSGLRLFEEPSFDVALANWAGSVASNGGEVAQVHGQPAWLLPPEPPDGDGAVSFVENEVMLRLIGNGDVPIATLHDIAESVEH